MILAIRWHRDCPEGHLDPSASLQVELDDRSAGRLERRPPTVGFDAGPGDELTVGDNAVFVDRRRASHSIDGYDLIDEGCRDHELDRSDPRLVYEREPRPTQPIAAKSATSQTWSARPVVRGRVISTRSGPVQRSPQGHRAIRAHTIHVIAATPCN